MREIMPVLDKDAPSKPVRKILRALLTERGPMTTPILSHATSLGPSVLLPEIQSLADAEWIDHSWEPIDPADPNKTRHRVFSLAAIGRAVAEQEFGVPFALSA